MKEKKSERIDVHITPSAKDLLTKLQQKLGLSQSSVIEMALRKLARAERIRHDTDDEPRQS